MEKSVPARRDSSEEARRKAGGAKGRRIERANRVGRGVAESPETSGNGAKFGFPRGEDLEDGGFRSEGNRRRQGCSPATKTKLSKVQPPDAENRTSGGGEGLRGVTPRSPIRSTSASVIGKPRVAVFPPERPGKMWWLQRSRCGNVRLDKFAFSNRVRRCWISVWPGTQRGK